MTDSRLVAEAILDWCSKQESIKAVRALHAWVVQGEGRMKYFPGEFNETSRRAIEDGYDRIAYELGLVDDDYNLKK